MSCLYKRLFKKTRKQAICVLNYHLILFLPSQIFVMFNIVTSIWQYSYKNSSESGSRKIPVIEMLEEQLSGSGSME